MRYKPVRLSVTLVVSQKSQTDSIHRLPDLVVESGRHSALAVTFNESQGVRKLQEATRALTRTVRGIPGYPRGGLWK